MGTVMFSACLTSHSNKLLFFKHLEMGKSSFFALNNTINHIFPLLLALISPPPLLPQHTHTHTTYITYTTHTTPKHQCSLLIESLTASLPPSINLIAKHVSLTFHCIHEASQESPAWIAYLHQIDSLVISGLKRMMLKAISTLIRRASKYEQGDTIPPLVMVVLELYGPTVQFSPPLSAHTAIKSVSEVVHKWMAAYLKLAKLVPRLTASVTGNCFESLSKDTELTNPMSTICAHLETNSRQSQVSSFSMAVCNLLQQW